MLERHDASPTLINILLQTTAKRPDFLGDDMAAPDGGAQARGIRTGRDGLAC